MVLPRKNVAQGLLFLPPVLVSVLLFFVCGASGVSALSIGMLSSFAFCDVWYFLRMGFDTLRPAPRGSRKHLFAVSRIKGRIGLMDIDRNGHCNNARFLRECGFGRRDLWQVRMLIELWQELQSNEGQCILYSASITSTMVCGKL